MTLNGLASEAILLSQLDADSDTPSFELLYAHACALKALKRTKEALIYNTKAARLYPQNAYAWYNLAATLGDLQHAQDAIFACDKAIGLGLTAPEVLLVKARAHVLLGQFDLGQNQYEAVLALNPYYDEALRELSQLIWMQTGDVRAACAPFDRADTFGLKPLVSFRRSKLYEFAGDPDKAYACFAPFINDNTTPALVTAAMTRSALLVGKDDEAYQLAQRAYSQASSDVIVVDTLFQVFMSRGEADKAFKLAQYRLSLAPDDQMSFTLLSTASRVMGNGLHELLYNYKDFVKPYFISTPQGWTSLEHYLNDLRQCLNDLHLLKAHPIDQSLRGGTQTHFGLLNSDAAPIKAYFAAIDPCIKAHMKHLGQGDDPIRSRNTNAYKIQGAWSVWLRSNGYHVDHVHPEGWLSSAFYIDVPKSSLDEDKKEGWIRFGQPPYRTNPPLLAEKFIRPQPGMLAIFPSYMWHGTVPFTSEERRMTIAIDIVPN